MLRIGLSGGIGAGKSTVSSTFSELGGIVVDGDVIAREVVEPGTEGLGKLVDAFGADILQKDGSLNRPALAAIAFSDDEKRQTLNGIVHPLVAHRRAELIAAAADDAVIVEDIPLLVESGMAPMFPLVVIVHADVETRVKRLIEHRGFTEEDARARIAAQATEEQRRAVADVWLDNSGSAGSWWSRRGRCGMSGSCRSPTTSTTAGPRAPNRSSCRATRHGPIRAAASRRGSTPHAGTGRCA